MRAWILTFTVFLPNTMTALHDTYLEKMGKQQYGYPSYKPYINQLHPKPNEPYKLYSFDELLKPKKQSPLFIDLPYVKKRFSKTKNKQVLPANKQPEIDIADEKKASSEESKSEHDFLGNQKLSAPPLFKNLAYDTNAQHRLDSLQDDPKDPELENEESESSYVPTLKKVGLDKSILELKHKMPNEASKPYYIPVEIGKDIRPIKNTKLNDTKLHNEPTKITIPVENKPKLFDTKKTNYTKAPIKDEDDIADNVSELEIPDDIPDLLDESIEKPIPDDFPTNTSPIKQKKKYIENTSHQTQLPIFTPTPEHHSDHLSQYSTNKPVEDLDMSIEYYKPKLPNIPENEWDSRKDRLIKTKLVSLILSTKNDLDNEIDRILPIHNAFKSGTMYKIGYLISLINKMNRRLSTLYAAVLNNAQNWDTLKMLDVYEKMKSDGNLVSDMVKLMRTFLKVERNSSIKLVKEPGERLRPSGISWSYYDDSLS